MYSPTHVSSPSRSWFRSHLLVAALIAFVLASSSVLEAQTTTVSATWNAMPESDIAGYVRSSGTQTGNCSASVDVGNLTSWQGQLNTGVRYYFAVKAYNTSLQFSANSVEVFFDVG